MTANEDFLDDQIRRAIQLEGFKDGTVRRILRLLRETEGDLEVRLRRSLDSFAHRQDTTRRSRRLALLLQFIRRQRGEAMDEAFRPLIEEAQQLAVDEARFQVASAELALPLEVDFTTPPAQTLRSLVVSRPFQGRVLRDHVRNLARADRDRIMAAVRLGIVEGEGTDDIVRRVIGTARQQGADGTLGITRRQVDALVRTVVSHVSNAARDSVWQANADIIEGLRWTATLDGRTSAICRARDGTVYPLNSGPRPPAHFRCRSVMVAVFDAETVVGSRPFVRDTRTPRAREVDFRQQARDEAGNRWRRMDRTQRRRAVAERRRLWSEENIGRVPAVETYQTWLQRQSASFQDEVLGPTRGALFRRGGLTLDRFVNRRGQELTLDQLRRTERAAFERIDAA